MCARAGMLSADENGPAAADGAQVNGVQAQQAQQEQLQLVPMNSFRRLLAFQELRKAQFGVQGHPGFFVIKVCWDHPHFACDFVRERRKGGMCFADRSSDDPRPSSFVLARWVPSSPSAVS
jgi:hypothetical protein